MTKGTYPCFRHSLSKNRCSESDSPFRQCHRPERPWRSRPRSASQRSSASAHASGGCLPCGSCWRTRILYHIFSPYFPHIIFASRQRLSPANSWTSLSRAPCHFAVSSVCRGKPGIHGQTTNGQPTKACSGWSGKVESGMLTSMLHLQL